MKNEQIAVRATIASVFGNLILAVIKWFAGYFGNSYALIADAIESTSDVFSSLLVLFGIKYSSRPPDKNHPYGHGRVEPLITFLVVAFLMTSATIIAYQSVINIRTPHELPKSYTLYVLGAIIFIKEFAYRWMLRKSTDTNSSVLKAEAWHHRSDAITSVAAFIGISIAIYLGNGYEAADDWAALLASGFIIYNSYLIFRPALGEIMDEHIYDELIADIRKVSLTAEGILGTEKCFVRKAGMKFHIELHALVDAQITVKDGHGLAHKLEDCLRLSLPQLGHILVHIEPFH